MRALAVLAAALAAVLRAFRNAVRRAQGIPPELDEPTPNERIAAEVLAPAAEERPPVTEPQSLGERLRAYLNAKLHGGPVPDMSSDMEVHVLWAESLSDAELARAAFANPAALERHVTGRERIEGLPQVVSLADYRALRDSAAAARDLAEENRLHTLAILEELMDDEPVAKVA